MAAVLTMLLSGFVTPAICGNEGVEQRKRAIAREMGQRKEVPTITKEDTTTTPRPKLEIHDSLRTTYKYTEGLKRLTIERDTAAALNLFNEALALDSTYAPALFQLAQISFYDSEKRGEQYNSQYEDYARKAYLTDTMSRWYTGLYGHALVVNRRFDEALEIYKRLIKIDSHNADNYRILSLLYQFRNQPYSAISIIDSADMRFGKLPQLQDLRRHLLMTTHQYDRAIEEAQQLVDQAPYDLAAVLTLAHTYIEAKRDSLADVTLKRAFEMDSTNVEMLTTYADLKYRQQDTHNYMRLLNILFGLREFPEAGKMQILERFMSNRTFYGEHYYSIGNLITSLAILDPDKKQIVDLYGEHLVAGGFVDTAIEHYKAHLNDTPPQIDYYMAVIDLEEWREMNDSVDLYVQRAMKIFPQNPMLYLRKANRQYLKSDLHGAIETFEQAMALSDNDTLRGEIWGYIGDTYHQIAERAVLKKADADTVKLYPVKLSEKAAMKRCYAAYDKSLSFYPDNSLVLNNYAYFLSLTGEDETTLNRALAMSSQAIALDKNNSSNLDTHAWILFKLGRAEEAQTYMRQALSLDNRKSPELNLHYGDILYALGKEFLAKTYWRKALEFGADPKEIEERINKLK